MGCHLKKGVEIKGGLVYHWEQMATLRDQWKEKMGWAVVIGMAFMGAVWTENLIKNPGFEAGADGKGIGFHWADDLSWAKRKVRHGEDPIKMFVPQSVVTIMDIYEKTVPIHSGQQHDR